MAGKNGSMNAPNTNECWIGFDLGGTKMMALVYDASFRPIVRKRRKTKGHEGAEAGLARIVNTIDEALGKAVAVGYQRRPLIVGPELQVLETGSKISVVARPVPLVGAG